MWKYVHFFFWCVLFRVSKWYLWHRLYCTVWPLWQQSIMWSRDWNMHRCLSSWLDWWKMWHAYVLLVYICIVKAHCSNDELITSSHIRIVFIHHVTHLEFLYGITINAHLQHKLSSFSFLQTSCAPLCPAFPWTINGFTKVKYFMDRANLPPLYLSATAQLFRHLR